MNADGRRCPARGGRVTLRTAGFIIRAHVRSWAGAGRPLKELGTGLGAAMTAMELGLTFAMTSEGTAQVILKGELDIASSEHAFDGVRRVIDLYHVPIIVDMSGVTFCDARGLGVLVRMSNYAGQEGCPLVVVSPSSRLLKIMRITGVDRRLLISVPRPIVPAGTLTEAAL